LAVLWRGGWRATQSISPTVQCRRRRSPASFLMSSITGHSCTNRTVTLDARVHLLNCMPSASEYTPNEDRINELLILNQTHLLQMQPNDIHSPRNHEACLILLPVVLQFLFK
jgi:hypothetical protein